MLSGLLWPQLVLWLLCCSSCTPPSPDTEGDSPSIIPNGLSGFPWFRGYAFGWKEHKHQDHRLSSPCMHLACVSDVKRERGCLVSNLDAFFCSVVSVLKTNDWLPPPPHHHLFCLTFVHCCCEQQKVLYMYSMEHHSVAHCKCSGKKSKYTMTLIHPDTNEWNKL